MKARCPECDELVTITPTGKRRAERGTDEWWRVLEHWREGLPCKGSGRLL